MPPRNILHESPTRNNNSNDNDHFHIHQQQDNTTSQSRHKSGGVNNKLVKINDSKATITTTTHPDEDSTIFQTIELAIQECQSCLAMTKKKQTKKKVLNKHHDGTSKKAVTKTSTSSTTNNINDNTRKRPTWNGTSITNVMKQFRYSMMEQTYRVPPPPLEDNEIDGFGYWKSTILAKQVQQHDNNDDDNNDSCSQKENLPDFTSCKVGTLLEIEGYLEPGTFLEYDAKEEQVLVKFTDKRRPQEFHASCVSIVPQDDKRSQKRTRRAPKRLKIMHSFGKTY